MQLNPFQQQVVDALIVALATYEQELPPETITQINALVDPNSNTIKTNAFLQEIKNYPPDFQAEYKRIKKIMQSEEVSLEQDMCIGEDVILPTPEGLKSNISAAILHDPDPQTKAKKTFLPPSLAKFLRKN